MEHVRLDEGLKRPRKKPGRKPSSPRRNNGDFIPILSNKPEDIKAALQDYINGATLEEIGLRHGVSRQAVYGWLLGELGGEEHRDLVTRALTARIARADEFLETGDNALDVTRGERMARHYRTDLERRRSSLYGQQQQLTVKNENLTDQDAGLLQSARSLLLEYKARQEKVINPSPNQLINKPNDSSLGGEQEGGVAFFDRDEPPPA